MTEGERIKQVRKSLGLSLEEFSKPLGVHKSAVSRAETGVNSVSGQLRASICKEYRVNEEWLRNGTGDMRTLDLAEEIEKVVVKYNLDDDETRLVKNFVELDSGARKRILAYMKEFVKLYQQDK